MNIKLNLRFVFVTLIFAVLLCGHKGYAQSVSALRTIVIDAGHGGEDGGCEGNGLVEKNLNLDISLQLAELLRKAGVNVVLTRETDCPM